MPPGSSWSDRGAFNIRAFDFSARHAYIETLLARHAATLERFYRDEDSVAADFESFRVYFEEMLRAVPGFIRRRSLAPIVFRPRDAAGRHCWLVDPRRAVVEEIAAAPAGCLTLDLHAAVLRDCTERKMFSVWSASKRLKITLPSAAALTDISRWFTVLDLYELDMLPLSRNFSPRSLAIRLRRWREPVELASLILKRVLLRRPMTATHLYPVKAV
jgi:hypothetical protein